MYLGQIQFVFVTNGVYHARKFNGYVPVFLVFAEGLSRKNVSVNMSKVFEKLDCLSLLVVIRV